MRRRHCCYYWDRVASHQAFYLRIIGACAIADGLLEET